MNYYCKQDDHEGNKISAICLEKSCNMRILCAQCQYDEHNQHAHIKIKDMLSYVQNVKNKKTEFERIHECSQKRIDQFKILKEDYENLLKKLDTEFSQEQHYVEQILNRFDNFNTDCFELSALQMLGEAYNQNLIEKSIIKLQKLCEKQINNIQSINSQLINFSSNFIIQNLIRTAIKDEKLQQFCLDKIKNNLQIPKQYQFIRGESFLRKQENKENEIYFGEFQNDKREGLGILIDKTKQVVYNGIWQQNNLLWSRKIFASFGTIRVIEGQMDNSLNPFGKCFMEDIEGRRYQFNLSSYEGSIYLGKMQGYGKLKYQNDDEYIGQFHNDQFSGEGKLICNQKNEQYTGAFAEGKKHGQGELITNRNNHDQLMRYQGEFRWDQITGKGEIVDKFGTVLQCGNFLNGKLHGKGIKTENIEIKNTCETIIRKLVYIGDFKEGMRDGYGEIYELRTSDDDQKLSETIDTIEFFNDETFVKANQELVDIITYRGEWHQNLYHGQGVRYFFNENGQRVYQEGFYNAGQLLGNFTEYIQFGDKFFKKISGIMQDGEINGKVTEYFDDETIEYQGEYKNGVRCGIGLLKYKCEEILEYFGEFQDDVKCGKGIEKYRSNQKYEGSFRNDLRDGFGTYYFNNNEIYEGEFYQGKMQGLGKIILPSGETEKGKWLNDQQIEVHEVFRKGENVAYKKKHYKNGTEVKKWF